MSGAASSASFAISVSNHGHRPRHGESLRVTLSSTRVDAGTMAQIAAWMALRGVKQGVMTDRLVAFAKAHGFTGANCGDEKAAGLPSTGQPAANKSSKGQRAKAGVRVKSKE